MAPGPRSAAGVPAFHGLDALRGIAAIAVLLLHLSPLFDAPSLAPSGHLAVDVFFLMSGFVVAHAYESRLPALGVAGFMRIRIIRFLPLFYLGGILGLARVAILLVVGTSDVSVAAAIAYFLFLPAPGDGLLAPLNAPAWSLLLEIYVNLAYAVLLPRLTLRVLVVVTVAAGATLLACAMDADVLGGGPHWIGLGTAVSRVVFSFSLGVVMFRLRAWRGGGGWNKGWLIACFAVAMSIPTSGAWDAAFVLLVSPTLVLLALRCGSPDMVSVYGARASYAIYAIHWPVIVVAGAALARLGMDVGAGLVGVTIAILVAAPLLDRHVDRPLRRWLAGSGRD